MEAAMDMGVEFSPFQFRLLLEAVAIRAEALFIVTTTIRITVTAIESTAVAMVMDHVTTEHRTELNYKKYLNCLISLRNKSFKTKFYLFKHFSVKTCIKPIPYRVCIFYIFPTDLFIFRFRIVDHTRAI